MKLALRARSYFFMKARRHPPRPPPASHTPYPSPCCRRRLHVIRSHCVIRTTYCFYFQRAVRCLATHAANMRHCRQYDCIAAQHFRRFLLSRSLAMWKSALRLVKDARSLYSRSLARILRSHLHAWKGLASLQVVKSSQRRLCLKKRYWFAWVRFTAATAYCRDIRQSIVATEHAEACLQRVMLTQWFAVTRQASRERQRTTTVIKARSNGILLRKCHLAWKETALSLAVGRKSRACTAQSFSAKLDLRCIKSCIGSWRQFVDVKRFKRIVRRMRTSRICRASLVQWLSYVVRRIEKRRNAVLAAAHRKHALLQRCFFLWAVTTAASIWRERK